MRRLIRIGLALACLTVGAGVAHGQRAGVTLVTLNPVTVRPVLEGLWKESVEANRELVACLGGYRDGDTFRINKARTLESPIGGAELPASRPELGSDSVSVSPYLTNLSIETCRPPEWIGTVHTHSARQEDLRYPKFSSFDRTVISFWHRRWRHESVFCVLFAADQVPYCEYQEGADRGPDRNLSVVH